jgi:hypothetical protein
MNIQLITRPAAPLLALLASLLLPGTAHGFYSASTGRWLSRDPLYEKGGLNLHSFVGNRPLGSFDTDGRLWTDTDGGSWPRPQRPPKSPPPPIDCSGYKKLWPTTCTDCAGRVQNDLYPKRAYVVCLGFAKQFTDDPQQARASCVANCLIAAEAMIQKSDRNCDDRNCDRLIAQMVCYAKCRFVPNPFNLPPGADVVGWQDLIPACMKRLKGTPIIAL